MGRLSRALSSLIQDLREPHGRMQTLENRPGRSEQSGLQTLESHDAQRTAPAPSAQPQGAPKQPSHAEVFNYLGRLADDYHLPRKLVYAVADAESSVNADIGRRPNYLMKHGQKVYRNGGPVILSWDYGLMQLNDKSRIGEGVKDPTGKNFKIGEDVKKDWKANARGAVAILAREYDVAEMEQGAGSTPKIGHNKLIPDIPTATESAICI